jgi:hypothetical protein
VRASGNTGSDGTSASVFTYADDAGNTFAQNVSAFENAILFNDQTGSLAPSPVPDAGVGAVAQPLQPGSFAPTRSPGGK